MKKKIMFMINSLYGGGAEKVIQTILNNLDTSKYEITLYSMHREKIDRQCYKSAFDYKVIFDDCKSNNKFIKIFNTLFYKVKGFIFNNCSSKVFYKLFIHEKYDVEIAFIEGESTKIIAGSSNKNSKKLAWVHIDLLSNPWTSFLYKDVIDEKNHYEKYDKIICVSSSVKESFIKKYKIADNVIVLHNPFDKKEILDKSNFDCDLKNNDFKMISVGRLEPQKGYDRLINIAAKLKSDGFKFKIYILGDGSLKSLLINTISEYELQDYVELLGFKENPYCYMKNCDLFVCSSRSEGYSTVIAEAIIIGMPIVSTDCAGIHELFGKYDCGLISKNNEEDLYQKLYEVLSDKSILSFYSSQSKLRGKEFSLEYVISKIEELINE